MKRLADEMNSLISRISGGREKKTAFRRAVIHNIWAKAVRDVFKESADLVLEHVNAVYVMSGEQGSAVRRFDRPRMEPVSVDGCVLVVYSDDSIVRSELDNRQELLKMKFREQGEHIEAMRIIPSMRDMKQRHPFRARSREVETSGGKGLSFDERRFRGKDCGQEPSRIAAGFRARSVEEKELDLQTEQIVALVEDDSVRAAFEKTVRSYRKNK